MGVEEAGEVPQEVSLWQQSQEVVSVRLRGGSKITGDRLEGKQGNGIAMRGVDVVRTMEQEAEEVKREEVVKEVEREEVDNCRFRGEAESRN